MSYQAAISLGVHVRLLAARADDSAAQVAPDVVVGPPASWEHVQAFAAGCDVITFDHELVDPAQLMRLEAAGHCVRPSPAVVALAQNKRRQRAELGMRGFPVPPHRPVASAHDVLAFADAYGWPVVAKAAQGGYDGRGVWLLHDLAGAQALLEQTTARGLDLLVEQHVPIEREIAVLVARRPSGDAVVYPVVETVQVNGICREVLAPAPIPDRLAVRAKEIGLGIAEAIGATGILAVELFVAGDQLLINELAARPHNSGHFSIEGCVTSQFENHLRAILDWPLGSPALVAPAVAMANVIGESDEDPFTLLPDALAIDGVHVHLYGKAARPGRKLGHVTVVGQDLAEIRARASRAARILSNA